MSDRLHTYAYISDDSAIIKFKYQGSSSVLAGLWREFQNTPPEIKNRKNVLIDLAEAEEIDCFFTAFLDYLFDLFNAAGIAYRIVNISDSAANTYQMFSKYKDNQKKTTEKESPERSFFVSTGCAVFKLVQDVKELIAFSGELFIKLGSVLLSPSKIKWKDFWIVFEKSGVNALPLVMMIGFLVGVIMAFQSAIPMRQFGADIFVADLVTISMFRELGPLMTAIILAGRSGSAFAAELGTMKVNEEINALQTMGLDPTRFLVISRVLAVCILTPFLTAFADFAGVFGGCLVMRSFGYPAVTFLNQITASISLSDFFGGLFKAFTFGVLIAAIGCLRGMQTGKGASAVGDSATRSVVSGIVLIVLLDGLFAVLYFYLGI